jgi:hypothetical protein
MKKGKSAEILLKIVQETFKDSVTTQIHHDYKIPNTDGNKRQIDILIEGRVNDFEVVIAIECKDHKRPVPAEKIEAFKGNCDRLPRINKKVFVSTNGYQKDAIKAAAAFSIELFDLKTISKDTVKNWLPIDQLNQKFEIQTPFTIGVIGDEKEISYSDNKDIIVCFEHEEKSKPMVQFVLETIAPELKTLRGYLLYELLKAEMKNIREVVRTVPFEITPSNAYFIDDNQKKFPIIKISSSVTTWMEVSKAEVIQGTIYQEFKGESKAHVLTIGLNDKMNAQLVVPKEKPIGFFLTDNKHNVQKLQLLATYDPKTKELKVEK